MTHCYCPIRGNLVDLFFGFSNFQRLVNGCINADFCVQGLILQRFSKSTRLPHLCTARNSKSSQIFVKLFHIFAEISAKIAIFKKLSSNFAPISTKLFSEFRWIIRNLDHVDKSSNFWISDEFWQTFLNCDRISIRILMFKSSNGSVAGRPNLST